MAKYAALESFLSKTPQHLKHVVFSFDQIEQIIGKPLPPSARNDKSTWWRNTRSERRSQAKAWLSAGWKQDIVSWHEGWVRFRRQR